MPTKLETGARQLLTWPRIKRIIIHPFVFAIFPVVSLYTHNIGRGFLGNAIGTMAVILLVVGALWLLVNLLVRNVAKSAIIVSLFFFLFFFYGHAINALTSILEKAHLLEKGGFLVEGQSSQLLWLAIWGILFVIVSYIVSRLPGDLRTATNFLNVIALALVAMMVASFAINSVNTFVMPRIRAALPTQVAAYPPPGNVGPVEGEPIRGEFRTFLPVMAKGKITEETLDAHEIRAREFMESWQENLATVSMNSSSDALPDIYYIVLDMYARADYLKEYYGVDNSEFLSFLTDRGFYVADKGRSNYPHTMLSLSSTLNLVYLDEIVDQVGETSTNHWPLVEMIRKNRVYQLLRSRGYSIVAFPSHYSLTEEEGVDIFIAPDSGWQPTEFQNILMESTPLVLMQETRDTARRELVLNVFDHLADAAEIDSPTFVFGYIPSPHDPFVFGANGEHRRSKSPFDYEYEEFVEAYRDQLIFVTKKVQEVVDEILAKSPTPPIIIIQSDHGPNSYFWSRKGFNLPESMSILNAYYFPDQNYVALSEDITPINTFRIVFNQYLGTDYELLENRNYFSRFWESPYIFEDVTDDVVNRKQRLESD